jgi:flagellar biosynthesis protein FlhG
MNGASDQADGLRRLLTRDRVRVLGVLGMSRGVGATTVAMNIAVALAGRGAPTLIVDEYAQTPGSVRANWGMAPGASVAGAAVRGEPLTAAASPAGGVRVLDAPAGTACVDPHALLATGMVVVDAALDADGQLSAMARMADDLVVVMQSTAGSMMAAYAGLKRLRYAHALGEFKFLVNEAPSERQARLAISNIVATSRRYLGITLTNLGWIAADAAVPEAARRHRTVCEADPRSAAAIDFRAMAAVLAPGRAASPPARADAPVACA